NFPQCQNLRVGVDQVEDLFEQQISVQGNLYFNTRKLGSTSRFCGHISSYRATELTATIIRLTRIRQTANCTAESTGAARCTTLSSSTERLSTAQKHLAAGQMWAFKVIESKRSGIWPRL